MAVGCGKDDLILAVGADLESQTTEEGDPFVGCLLRPLPDSVLTHPSAIDGRADCHAYPVGLVHFPSGHERRVDRTVARGWSSPDGRALGRAGRAQ